LLATERVSGNFRPRLKLFSTGYHRYNTRNSPRREIGTLTAAIDRAHSELASIDKRVDDIANNQLSEIEVDGAPMRAQKLAELVVTGHKQHGWFDDVVGLGAENAPPLSDEESVRLREARRKLGSDLIYAHSQVPSADDLPATATIAELHAVLARMKTIEAEVARGELLSLKATTPNILETAREFLSRIDEAKNLAEELETFEDGWPMELRRRCRLSTFAAERKALESLFKELNEIIEARAEFLKRPVIFPKGGLASPKTLQAIARGANKGKPFGPITIGNGNATKYIAAVRVAGRAPSGEDDWAHVQRFVKLHEQVFSFLTRWNQFAETLSVPHMDVGATSLRRIEIVGTITKKAHRLATYYDALLPKMATEVFDRPLSPELIESTAELAGIHKQLVRHLTRAELSRAAIHLNVLQEKLAGKSGPITDRLRSFVAAELGNPSYLAERVTAHYAELVAELRRIASLSVELGYIRDYVSRIERAGASKFASRLGSQPVDGLGEDHVFPVTWRQAWNWARVRSYLDNIEARQELLTLSARRRDLEGGLARLYKEMVAKAAWLATKGKASPKVLQALAGYGIAIRRIGQGTGPNAMRYRRDARETMLDAAGAVPCWIMSHARISEAMPPDIGLFDLVIVDEASQSNLWALPAILRGKKILVVGDDKQVSPDAGFIAGQRIVALKARFLADQPYGTEMTPEKSLYELAARVFAAEQVMLREHFRCVPPIIAYSNRQFYKGGICPLRIPKASERIDPPLVDIYVPSGARDRRDCNDAEAQVIAEEISRILQDERLANRSIGVVSLLGIEQAKHIDTIVRQRIDAGELHRRNFDCGDARTFQGSERHHVFCPWSSIQVTARRYRVICLTNGSMSQRVERVTVCISFVP